jgi:nucleotide-binding universal stress UspA family protein
MSGTTSAERRKPLRVIAGVDGSSEANDALVGALDLLGDRIGHLTIAVVLDYDGDLSNVASAEHDRAREILRSSAEHVRDRVTDEPETVVLVGRPADALVRHARETNGDVIVVGPRGRGASRFLFGSVASRLARGVGVPVMIIPPRDVAPVAPDEDERAAST